MIFQSLTEHCANWLRTDVEYRVDADVIHLFPERYNHEKLLLYHNVNGPQTYK